MIQRRPDPRDAFIDQKTLLLTAALAGRDGRKIAAMAAAASSHFASVMGPAATAPGMVGAMQLAIIAGMDALRRAGRVPARDQAKVMATAALAEWRSVIEGGSGMVGRPPPSAADWAATTHAMSLALEAARQLKRADQ